MTQRPRVLVMMASYNGMPYIVEQIESILYQEDVDVTLLISDDGSTDATLDICEEYARRCPNVVFRRNAENKGAGRNFMDMVYETDPTAYDYYAFSDQDDLWFPEKLICGIQCLEAKAATVDSPHGYLYYSDVHNVSVATGQNMGSPSNLFESHQYNLATLLIVNWAAGCTMVFDQRLCALLQRYAPPAYPRYHDAWVHLVALSLATTAPDLRRAFIVHNKTGKNLSGQVNIGRFSLARVGTLLAHIFLHKDHYAANEARYLLEGYGDLMDEDDRALVELVSELDTSVAARTKAFFDRRFWIPGVLEKLSLRTRMLFNYL